MIQHSEGIQKIAAALVKIAGAIENPHKTSENPHFRSRYADLAEIINTSRAVCAKHGVTVVQSPGMDEHGLCTVETLLLHESGEWIRGLAKSPIQKPDPQGVGSAITYLRRYSLAALLGLAQEDDDANAASGSGRDASGKPHRPAQPKPTTETCPKCKASEIYDNRAKKAAGEFSGKSPDYACKDKDGCGWALWLDSANAALKSAVENMEVAGTVPAGSTKRIMDGVQDGELASLRIAQDWVNSKQTGDVA